MAPSPRNNTKPTLSPVMMLAPAAILLLGYHYFFHTKSQSRLSTLRAQETKLVKESETFDRDGIAQLDRMRRLKSEQENIKDQTQKLEIEKESLQRQREELGQRLVRSGRPAETVQAVVRLIEAHGLAVIDNEIDTRSGESITSKESKEIASLLGLVQTSSEVRGGQRLILEGTFQEMRRAMHAIREEIPGVAVNWLSLQEVDLRTDLRIWTLSVSH